MTIPTICFIIDAIFIDSFNERKAITLMKQEFKYVILWYITLFYVAMQC